MLSKIHSALKKDLAQGLREPVIICKTCFEQFPTENLKSRFRSQKLNIKAFIAIDVVNDGWGDGAHFKPYTLELFDKKGLI